MLEPYSQLEIIDGEPRAAGNSAFKRLVLSLMAMQPQWNENDGEEMEAFLMGSKIEVVIAVARGLAPARIDQAGRLSQAHVRILEKIVEAYPDTPTTEGAANEAAVGQLMFMPICTDTSHEQIDRIGQCEQDLLAFLTGQGMGEADAAALVVAA